MQRLRGEKEIGCSRSRGGGREPGGEGQRARPTSRFAIFVLGGVGMLSVHLWAFGVSRAPRPSPVAPLQSGCSLSVLWDVNG